MRFLLGACLFAAAATLGGSSATKVSLPLTADGGMVRKCTEGYGTYAGREDSLSLNGNKGVPSHDDTSDTADGWCAFHSNRDFGSVQNYSASVDMHHVKASNIRSHGGIAFNVISKCHFDFVYFRPHSPGGCIQLGSMRGCHWTLFTPTVPCMDSNPTWDRWYSIKVDVTGDMVSVFKKELAGSNAVWVRSTSVATNSIFGDQHVARVGLLVGNGHQDTTYFSRFELEYSSEVASKSFSFELVGTAATSVLYNAKRDALARFQGVSSDLSTHFVAEPSESTTVKGAFNTVLLPLTVDGGDVRKCTPLFGTFGGREGTMSLNANKGTSCGHDDTSDSLNGFCAYHSHDDMGSYRPYKTSVDMYHVVNGNAVKHAGLAFNIVDKCTYDFVYFRPHSTTGCFQVSSMRGCVWSSFRPQGECPDGVPPRGQWYSIQVEVTADTVVISKKNFGAAWAQVTSIPTSNIFGNHPVARVGVFVANGYQDTAYFNRLELAYTPVVAKNGFLFQLSGTAGVTPLGDVKRATVDAFRNISSDLRVSFSTEPSRPRRLLLV